MLILAWDIALAASAVNTFKDRPVPILCVLGNHEFYSRTLQDVL